MEMIMRIRFLLLALLVPLSPAAAQQDITLAVASSPADTARSPGPGAPFVAQRLYGTVLPAAVAAGYRPAPFHAAGMVELRQDRELSITGGIVGALLGAAVGGALACLANRDSYGAYCAGQNDTVLVIGVVIGAGVGGWIGAVLPRRWR
jgi:hypothetical protein